MIGFQDHIAPTTAIAATRTSLGPVLLALERDAPFAAVAGSGINLNLIDEHKNKFLRGEHLFSGVAAGLQLPVTMPHKKGEARASPCNRFGTGSALGFHRRFGLDIHPVAIPIKTDFAIGQRKQRPIPARADILAGDKFGSPLANQDAARCDELAAIPLYAQPLADAVAPIADAALTFLMCHKTELSKS
jgi:hypothetical protein